MLGDDGECGVAWSHAKHLKCFNWYRSYRQGREATGLYLRASIDDEIARSVVVHVSLLCVCAAAREHAASRQRSAEA